MANASEADNAASLAPPIRRASARSETPRYRLLGEAARDRAAAGAMRAFTTVMPNGMEGSLTFRDVDRFSSAFAAYLRETSGSRRDPGSRSRCQTDLPIQLSPSACSKLDAFSSMSIRSIPRLRWRMFSRTLNRLRL